ncbi:TetR/AcrR family transcriptional regulator [Streptacidiphilus sp. ASG 303]|uniref:TetR/AcrR family transcriptional regulator n=1 Tax=Streptacidiphilus sp. ASG 303 TaxID=2896847 RepID=UPI001E2EB1E6|nr:TetR/AcrR family transcriptional regulator [Streptacidiphilus sp. ASG 303]MCD0484657.1 TetR/AcrR family transcriptional regulator [Streptacidiphilus sp. ASG 303]
MTSSPDHSKAAAPRDPVAAPVRRRGKALERAIFEATLDQLTSGGFARLTMEGVAGAAQTGKAALYRRWASKQDLVLDALDSSLPPATDIPDRGSVREELRDLMRRMCATVQSPGGCAVRVLMAELEHERAQVFAAFTMKRVVEPAKRAVLEILRRGEARGDVRPGAAVPLVADVAPALLLYRAKLHGGSLPEDFADQVVDQVLLPMVRPLP